jgi:ArsR family transcriptional regulator, arsenate/arsenite/antimonite-responsive transcriptional repressor
VKKLELELDEARTLTILRALANPARLRIVRILAERNECVCGEVAGDLPLAQSTVSEHLKVLKEAGVVQGTIQGPNTCYCLEPESLRFLLEALSNLAQSCCGEDSPSGQRSLRFTGARGGQGRR